MKCFDEQHFYLLIGVAILCSALCSVLFEMLVTKFTSKKRGRKAKKNGLGSIKL